MKITELTESQQQRLVEVREEALKIGYSTDPINREEVEEAIGIFYSSIRKPVPHIFYCWSPIGNCFFPNLRANLGAHLWAHLEANLGDNLRAHLGANLGDNLRAHLGDNLRANLRANLRDNLWAHLEANLWDNLWAHLGANLRDNLRAHLGDNLRANWHRGGHELHWIVFYKFCEEIGVKYSKKDSELLNAHYLYAKNALWMNSYEKVAFVCERPTEINVIPSARPGINVLHADGKMAIKFKDGYGLWMLNGVSVSKEIVMTPAHDLSAELVLTEKNAEVRREIVRKIGIERVLQKLNAKILDKQGDYELVQLRIENMRIAPTYLKMKNPSIGVWHVEGVSSEIKTVQQALNFRAGRLLKSGDWKPEQLT